MRDDGTRCNGKDRFSEVGRITIDNWGPYRFKDNYPSIMIPGKDEYLIAEIEQQGNNPRKIEVILIIK